MSIIRKTMPRHGVDLLWSTRQISLYFSWAVVGYITYFCTDAIGLNAAIVGTLFLVSKIVDAISNFIIAYIVDNCNFKLGKGRPWELNIVPMWVSLILIFCIQDSWGIVTKYALVFLYYTLYNAVFATFLCCTDSIYFKHTFADENQRNRIQAITGAIAMLAMTAGGIAMPILIAYFQDVQNGWSIMALIVGVPMALIGTVRFFTIPETEQIQAAAENRITIKDTIYAFVGNKYVIIVAIMYFAINLNNNFATTPATYYFKYIVGNIALQSTLSVVSLAAMASLLICVPLANKVGRVKVLRVCFALTSIACLCRFFAGSNVLILAICQLVAAVVTYPFNAFSALMLIDCMDYGEWKNGKAAEGAIYAAAGLGSTIGNGVGSSLSGILLTAFGYDGTAEVQTASALFGIKFCYAIIPCILMAAIVAVLFFYDLEKKMPQIHKELDERHAAQAPVPTE